MNKNERKFLIELKELLNKVPFPTIGGTSSISLKGLVSYQNDMRLFLDSYNKAFYHFICNEVEEAQEYLNKLKEFVAQREKEG